MQNTLMISLKRYTRARTGHDAICKLHTEEPYAIDRYTDACQAPYGRYPPPGALKHPADGYGDLLTPLSGRYCR